MNFIHRLMQILVDLELLFSGYTFDSITVSKTSLQCLENLSTMDFEKLHCNNIHLINDSNATALAGLTEYPTAKVLVGITNGTGIGCGVVINGHLFTGSNHILGEIYGNTVIENNNITKIGRICSGSKILKNYQKNLMILFLQKRFYKKLVLTLAICLLA